MKSTPSAPPPDDPVIPLPSSVMWFLLTTVEAGQRTILPAHLDTADTLAAFDGSWWCTCDARSLCSHLVAAQLVCRGTDAPRSHVETPGGHSMSDMPQDPYDEDELPPLKVVMRHNDEELGTLVFDGELWRR